jgi:hypothetical protein
MHTLVSAPKCQHHSQATLRRTCTSTAQDIPTSHPHHHHLLTTHHLTPLPSSHTGPTWRP